MCQCFINHKKMLIISVQNTQILAKEKLRSVLLKIKYQTRRSSRPFHGRLTNWTVPGKTRSSSCVMVVMPIGRTVTMNCESGDVCSPSVTVKLKPPDWSPDTQP